MSVGVVTVVLLVVLFRLADHALAVQLLFTHLVEVILLIVTISDDACDFFS